MIDETVTIKDFSSCLKTSEKTIYRLFSKNEISAFKVGTIWRFKKDDIGEWIKEKSWEVT